jgi:acetyl-CoA acetyltransferase
MTGIPVVNVNNNCSTGSTALFLARQAVASGAADCALALGFEQMQPGALGANFPDRPAPFERFDRDRRAGRPRRDPAGAALLRRRGAGPHAAYGTPMDTFAKIRAKASRHAANNPLALFRNVVTTEEVMASPMMWPGVLTRLMACPPTCGAAAAIVCSEAFASRHGLDRSVRIRAQAMTTDRPAPSRRTTCAKVVGYSMAAKAARTGLRAGRRRPGRCRRGRTARLLRAERTADLRGAGPVPEGGARSSSTTATTPTAASVVTNPSGGLLSKGHPLGATGLAQCTELVQQLRGTADSARSKGARLALQHNLGLGGACVVTMYEKV